MATLNSLFETFLRERTYLKNVSPKTRIWYESAWKSFKATQPPEFADDPITAAAPITRTHLTGFVVALRDRRLRTVSVNTWLRALNAYCRWLHEAGESCERVSLRPLRAEKRFFKTLDDTPMRAILCHRPSDYSQWRVRDRLGESTRESSSTVDLTWAVGHSGTVLARTLEAKETRVSLQRGC